MNGKKYIFILGILFLGLFVNIGYAFTWINSSTTISSPGYYKLGNDISGNITIRNTGNVILDLNGHIIYGYVVIQNTYYSYILNNISIINGQITGNIDICYNDDCNANVTINNVHILKNVRYKPTVRKTVSYLNLYNSIVEGKIYASGGYSNLKYINITNSYIYQQLYISNFISIKKIVIDNSVVNNLYTVCFSGGVQNLTILNSWVSYNLSDLTFGTDYIIIYDSNVTLNGGFPNAENLIIKNSKIIIPKDISTYLKNVKNSEITGNFNLTIKGNFDFENVTITGLNNLTFNGQTATSYIRNSTIENNKIIVFNSNVIYEIVSSRLCNNEIDMYFNETAGAKGMVYYSYFDTVYPNVTAILNYPDNSYWCDGTPRFGPFNLTFIPPTPENNATVTERQFTVKVNSTKPLLWCKLIFNGNEYFMNIIGLDRRIAEHTITGLDDGDYAFKVICESLEYTYAETELRTIHVKIRFHNELWLIGYFDLTQEPRIEIAPNKPFYFDFSKVPFRFDLDHSEIHIDKVIVKPRLIVLHNYNGSNINYERHEMRYVHGLTGGRVVYQYDGGIGGNYQYTLGFARGEGYGYTLYEYYIIPISQEVTADKVIHFKINIIGEEYAKLSKKWTLLSGEEEGKRGIIPIFQFLFEDTYTGQTYNCYILPVYYSLQPELRNEIDEFFKNNIVYDYIKKGDTPLTKDGYEFNFYVNDECNVLGSRYKLKLVTVGILSPIRETIEMAKPIIIFSKTLQFTPILPPELVLPYADIKVNGYFKVNYLMLDASSPYQEIIEPPFPIYVNGQKPTTKHLRIDMPYLEIYSDSYVELIGSIKIYGTIKVPFQQINNYTYFAKLIYNYSAPFYLENVKLYQLPQQYKVLLKTEYYLNNSQITWVHTWDNETEKDISNYFTLIDNLTGYTYELKPEVKPEMFDPTNGAKLEYWQDKGAETYEIKYYTIDVPNVNISNIILAVRNNIITGLDVELTSTNVNVTNKVILNVSVACENQTYLTSKEINIDNKTTYVTVDLTKFLSQFEGKTIYCKVYAKIEPEIDYVKADNIKTVGFTLTITKLNLTGNIIVKVYDAKTLSLLSNVTVKLYYVNDTLLSQGTTDINGTVIFTNITYGYYYVNVNTSGYYEKLVMFYHTLNKTLIYVYLVPSTINTSTEGVLQVCLRYKDGEPIEDYPVNVYNLTGTLIATFKVNSTGCGSIVLPVGTYIVNTTFNNETLQGTIYVKPYTDGFSELILISNATTGRAIPEVTILFAQIIFSEGISNANYPVYIYTYSTVPQNISIKVTLQKFVNGTWIDEQVKTINVSFTGYRQTIKSFVSFPIFNITDFETYRAKVEIISYESDTNTTNNIFITNNLTVHVQIDVGIFVNPKTYELLPDGTLQVEVEVVGNVKLLNKLIVEYEYFDVLENKTITKTETYILETGKNKTIELTVPYAPEVKIKFRVEPINFSQVDVYPENNFDDETFYILPDVRIINVTYRKVLQSGEVTPIIVEFLSNRPTVIFVKFNKTIIGQLQLEIGKEKINLEFTAPTLQLYELKKDYSLDIVIDGDMSETGNTYTFTITVVNPIYYTAIIIIVIIGIIILLIKTIPRLVSRHMLFNEEFEFIRRKR